MHLSWNEIRARAAAFSADNIDTHYEKGEAQTFYNEFFDVFGIKRRRVAVFESQVKKLNDKQGFIDLFWPGVMLAEQKSAGRDLAKARAQAEEYCLGLKAKEHPRFILVSDFKSFELYDLETGEDCAFPLTDLHKNVEKFGFILGKQKREFRDQDPVNIEASEIMGRLHDALEASGYRGHDLEQYLVRLLFLLFADDTGIFEPRGIFQSLIEDRTAEDGSDLGGWIAALFQTLNTDGPDRSTNLDEDLSAFPYVNGDLFSDTLPMPSFTAKMRERLIEACNFGWDAISPAIFGSLFQSVMNATERRKAGAHYTTEKNILKVISPLFLDDLRSEFEALKARKTQRRKLLQEFHTRLGTLTFFDPACGCGNFLIIAYREIRQLETEVLKEVHADVLDRLKGGATELPIHTFVKIDVDQFYGIEIGEFPARIAEVAMWMMDHIMNNKLSLEFGQSFVRIPLRKSPHIYHDDALELDWARVIPPQECSYVLGNPPFIGAKVQTQEQREQVRGIARLGKSGGTLDYVTAWFLKAGEYVGQGRAKIGFVSTNSITQGEQVAQLWPLLFGRCKLEIAFAHRTFAWGSDARGKAHVHVVIIGLARRDMEPKVKRLFSYEDINGEPEETIHDALTAYLFDATNVRDRHLVVKETSKPLNGLPKLLSGSQPIDDGNYSFDAEQRDAFLNQEPSAAKFIRPFIGSREFLQGKQRWILALQSASVTELKALPLVRERMRAVRDFRSTSKRKSTVAIADYPHKFNVEVIPNEPFLVFPKVSSERRHYLPIGKMNPPTLPSDLVFVLIGESGTLFPVFTSSMHMAWLRHIGGRLKSDYRYSIGLVYNTFPMPPGDPDLTKLEPLAQAVLDARATHLDATLADLYDPDLMPANLRKAHSALDRAVDRLYRKKLFDSERERVEHLFGLYEVMTAPMDAAAKAPRRKRSRGRAKPPMRAIAEIKR